MPIADCRLSVCAFGTTLPPKTLNAVTTFFQLVAIGDRQSTSTIGNQH
jgi:hypothetical protein